MTFSRRVLLFSLPFAALLGSGVLAAAAQSAALQAASQGTTGSAVSIIPNEEPIDTIELYRIRIANQADGAIQVSTDEGASYRLIGRVVVPASGTKEGYIAAEYAKPGTVAATAVHGHRIRISEADPSLHAPRLISIDPKEYVKQALPTSYGGHRPGASGIYTDIPAGTSLFRELSPINGSDVFLESANSGRLFPITSSFRPAGTGEVIVIPVRAARNALTSVTIENRGGGKVEGTFADGTTRQITETVQPVQGVGRFDGTAYTGVGRLNTAHTGVITVSTAPINGALPEGQGKERRGGFQISPAWHNARTEEAGAPMVLILGEFGKPRRSVLEGKARRWRTMGTPADPGRIAAGCFHWTGVDPLLEGPGQQTYQRSRRDRLSSDSAAAERRRGSEGCPCGRRYLPNAADGAGAVREDAAGEGALYLQREPDRGDGSRLRPLLYRRGAARILQCPALLALLGHPLCRGWRIPDSNRSPEPEW